MENILPLSIQWYLRLSREHLNFCETQSVSHRAPDRDSDNRVNFTFFSQSESLLTMRDFSSSWFVLYFHMSFSGQGVTSRLHRLMPSTSAASAPSTFQKILLLQILQPQVRKKKLKYGKILYQEGSFFAIQIYCVISAQSMVQRC